MATYAWPDGRAARSTALRLTASLVVGVFVVSAVGATVGARAAVAADPVTALYIDSEPGEALANGRSFVIFEEDTTFVGASAAMSGERVEVWFQLEPNPWPRNYWRVEMAAPPGEQLAPGTYTNAVRPGSNGPGQPGLMVTRLDATCDENGSFTIHELSREGDTVNVVSASFAFEPCWQGDAYGEVRYNASTGFQAATVDPISVDFGQTVTHVPSDRVTVSVKSAGTEALQLGTSSITGTDRNSFDLRSSTCDGSTLDPGSSCVVRMLTEPRSTGVHQATLRVGDGTHRGERVVPLKATGWQFAWGKPNNVTLDHNYTWSGGHALAATQESDDHYQHALYESSVINGRWVTDSGPYAGVFYRSSGVSTDDWGGKKRINQKTMHGSRSAIAASGEDVHAVWVGMRKYADYKPKAPRVLYVRSNRDHGRLGAWGPIIRLSDPKGRVDYPTVAADGDNVFVAWTNSKSGKVKVAISRDRGRTWKKLTLAGTGVEERLGLLRGTGDRGRGEHGRPRLVATQGRDRQGPPLHRRRGDLGRPSDGRLQRVAPRDRRAQRPGSRGHERRQGHPHSRLEGRVVEAREHAPTHQRRKATDGGGRAAWRRQGRRGLPGLHPELPVHRHEDDQVEPGVALLE